jgi:hypothetical protein
MSKITAYSSLTAPALNDVLVIVDASDTTMAPTGTDKKITVANLCLSQQASTGASGYTLVNGTGNIITWTAPNDGALHRVLLMFTLHITSTETGGQVSVTLTTPDGGAATFANAISAGGGTTGTFTPGTNGYFVQAGTTLTVKQNTALTAGAAVLWAELWAS